MWYPYEWLEVVPVTLLTQLPNLCRLELEVDLVYTSHSLSPSRFTLSALRVYSLPIQHLELSGVTFSCINDAMRYLSAFLNLSSLAVRSVDLMLDGAVTSTDALSHYSLKLTHLEVSSSLQTSTSADVRPADLL